jgi:hypothetical protein
LIIQIGIVGGYPCVGFIFTEIYTFAVFVIRIKASGTGKKYY